MSQHDEAHLVLHYAPRTRSFVALWLLEELGAPCRLQSFDINTGHHESPEHLALNPMGKVPVVVDHGIAVSELGAVAIYLADRYPAAGLSPTGAERTSSFPLVREGATPNVVVVDARGVCTVRARRPIFSYTYETESDPGQGRGAVRRRLPSRLKRIGPRSPGGSSRSQR
ncbi:MAG: hypothetical protein OHK0013_31210 [Sandaracinaceae bacterium]